MPDLFRLLLDFGVVVLIWLVQLVIYPSFLYFSRKGMDQWHQQYTLKVSFVVMPLMLGQLVLALYQLIFFTDLYTLSSAVLIGIAWVLTFFFAVPLHNAIPIQEEHLPLVKRLIYINWYRTLVWNLAFFISLVRFLQLPT